MKRSLVVEINKPVLTKYAEDYFSSRIVNYVGGSKSDIVCLFRDYIVVFSRIASCAIYKLLADNYKVNKTSGGDDEELPFPVIRETTLNRTSPYTAIYFVEDNSGNKFVVRLHLSRDPYTLSNIYLYLPEGKLDVGNKFFQEFEQCMKMFNNLRLKGDGEFLEPIQTLGDSDLVLPDDLKRAIKSNVVNYISRYKSYVESAEPKVFNHLKRGGRGLILFGPPGTGKSLTIRWLMSSMSDCNFIVVTGENIRRGADIANIFTLARMIKPTVVVLEDVDIYGLSRDNGSYPSGILNELLTQLDGPQFDMAGIVTIATANKSEVLDKALSKRPGRFDVILNYKEPAINERLHLLKLTLSKVLIDEEINYARLADLTEGFSSAQIVEVVKRGCIIADERVDDLVLHQEDLVAAVNQLKEPTKEIGFKTKES